MRAPWPPLLLLAGIALGAEAAVPAAPAGDGATPAGDPYLWLEEVEGARALAWVAQRNAESNAAFEADPAYGRQRGELLRLLDDPARIPYGERIGAYYYNFWRDAGHRRGLWRRTGVAEYRRPGPDWEVVLDLDELARKEGENWVWQGVTCLQPDAPGLAYQRCLVSLSRGGADAAVVREFDLAEARFVDDGFRLPEAKSMVGWQDLDHLWVSTDFGPGSLTESGYPRIVKRWQRGTPLAAATTVYEGQVQDLDAYGSSERESGQRRDWIAHGLAFWKSEWFLLRDGQQVRLEIPLDASHELFQDQLVVRLRSPWTIGGQTHPADSVLAVGLDAFLRGDRRFETLWQAGPGRVFEHLSHTRNAVLVGELDHISSRWHELTRTGGRWHSRQLGLPAASQAQLVDVDRDSDDYLIEVQDSTTPNTLLAVQAGSGEAPVALKRLPAAWDASGVVATRHEATSRDGTRIPYLVIAHRDLPLDGSHPTLLTGYGGFEISMLPGYYRLAGKGWIEPGGVYVVANIRGGGEFGPDWHRAALKEHRQRCFDDFAAVAQDLVRRRITSPPHLGILGGSNGGLLVTATMVQHPELFGAVVAQVPLTDMLRFRQLLAGASWIAEYGDPDEPSQRAYLARYSPYQNVRAGVDYPPVFLTTSTRDDRVHPGHARKMAARMIEQGHRVLYYENTEGGHGGAADNAQVARMWAQTFSFLRSTIGQGR